MTPHKCPVCYGSGKVYQGENTTDTCPACNGKGYVVVDDTVYVVQPVFRYEIHAT